MHELYRETFHPFVQIPGPSYVRWMQSQTQKMLVTPVLGELFKADQFYSLVKTRHSRLNCDCLRKSVRTELILKSIIIVTGAVTPSLDSPRIFLLMYVGNRNH